MANGSQRQPQRKQRTVAEVLAEQGRSSEDVASSLGVDVGLVDDWLMGQTPEVEHRRQLALLVDIPSRRLWPEATAEHDTVALTCDQVWRTPAAAWRTLIESAGDRIDILGGGYGWFVMHGADGGPTYTGDFRTILDDKRTSEGEGPDVRVCMAHPFKGDVLDIQAMQESTVDDFKGKSLKHSLALIDGIELWAEALEGLDRAEHRLAEQGCYVAWMARFDNRIVWVPQLWGTRSHVAASYLVERTDVDSRFDELVRHFEAVWESADRSPVDGPALRIELRT